MQNWVGTKKKYLQIQGAPMLLWEEQMSVWRIIEAVSAETHHHSDKLGILTREDRLETQSRGKMRSECKLVCEGKSCVFTSFWWCTSYSVLCPSPVSIRSSGIASIDFPVT